ncbi:hypothetical protein BaRGS_00020184 [Batillaria attramentaria]|uniref:Uncharacterized protein n=1 Tax=Batillaria attramentaria TaxID=370345 RepID=A0ABD0KN15_9CAEN
MLSIDLVDDGILHPRSQRIMLQHRACVESVESVLHLEFAVIYTETCSSRPAQAEVFKERKGALRQNYLGAWQLFFFLNDQECLQT